MQHKAPLLGSFTHGAHRAHRAQGAHRAHGSWLKGFIVSSVLIMLIVLIAHRTHGTPLTATPTVSTIPITIMINE